MKKIIPLLLLVLVSSVAYAIDDTPENRRLQAERYLEVNPPSEISKDIAKQMAKGMPPEKREAFTAGVIKDINIGVITAAMRDALIKTFTADELSALADFYSSPVGGAAMKKMSTYMRTAGPAVQAEAMKAGMKARQDLDSPKKSP